MKRIDPLAPVPTPARLVEDSRLTVADVALAYERAVLELDLVSETTRNRALLAVGGTIVPLAGWLRFDELTPELCRGVQAVLSELGTSDDNATAYIWGDLVRWGRVHYLRHIRRWR